MNGEIQFGSTEITMQKYPSVTPSLTAPARKTESRLAVEIVRAVRAARADSVNEMTFVAKAGELLSEARQTVGREKFGAFIARLQLSPTLVRGCIRAAQYIGEKGSRREPLPPQLQSLSELEAPYLSWHATLHSKKYVLGSCLPGNPPEWISESVWQCYFWHPSRQKNPEYIAFTVSHQPSHDDPDKLLRYGIAYYCGVDGVIVTKRGICLDMNIFALDDVLAIAAKLPDELNFWPINQISSKPRDGTEFGDAIDAHFLELIALHSNKGGCDASD